MATKATKPRPKGTQLVEQVTARVEGPVTRFSARDIDQAVGEVKFGRVVVIAAAPSADQTKRNIAAGSSALGRAKSVLQTPGVRVRVDPNVPLYHADPATPGLLVRKLNGQTARGRLVAGRFKPQ